MSYGYGTNPDKPATIMAIEEAMAAKYGAPKIPSMYTQELANLQTYVEQHPDWHMKRTGAHRWEVRNGLKDKTYYGQTLAIALCKALLELP